MENFKLAIIGFWGIGADWQLKRGLELSPDLPDQINTSEKYCSWLCLLVDQIWWSYKPWFKNKYSKIYPLSCANTRYHVADLQNYRMFTSTKNWISQVGWQWNREILHLCFRWHTLRIYRLVVWENIIIIYTKYHYYINPIFPISYDRMKPFENVQFFFSFFFQVSFQ